MKETKDIEIERKVWSECFLCEEEYSTTNSKLGGVKDGGHIVMNKECLHSYCKECIEQSASTSLQCPICHSSLSTPLSSLPINFTLCYWQTLSPPLPSFTLPSHPLVEEDEKKLCEDCDENIAEVHCSDCKISVCHSCSDSIHSRRVMKNHSISPITSSSSSLRSSILSVTSPIIQFYQCEVHNNEEQKLYCMTCNECICVDCTSSDLHTKHSITNIIKCVEDIKEEWKKRVEEISNDIINNQLKEVEIQSDKLSNEIDQVDEEIKSLEDTLKNLIEKKERMIADLKMMSSSKEKIDQTTSFLLFFLRSLPPLPLSSFLPSANKNENNIIIEMKENIEEKGRRRIREFFGRENLFSLYSSLLPLPEVKEGETEEETATTTVSTKRFNENDIKLVIAQTNKSREEAIAALEAADGDMVTAILNLSF